MARTDRMGARCVVVGGGLAGLAAGLRLREAGHEVALLEAGADPGGRTRTTWHRGRPVARGFQVTFAGYRETRRFARAAGVPKRDLRPMSGGAVFVGPDGARPFPHSPTALARFEGLVRADRCRLAKLGAEVLRGDPASRLGAGSDEWTTEEFLRGRGFGEEALDRFFRPFFGNVFLDHSLSADAGYFRFLLASMARGPAVIPSDGQGMLADWACAALGQRGGDVALGSTVEALELDGRGERIVAARTADGDTIEGDWFVLAVDPQAARRLLEPLDDASAARVPAEPASVVTASFALSQPLYRGRAVLVNTAARPTDGPHVDVLCQTTNTIRPGSPAGTHIVLAGCVTTDGRSGEGLAGVVERQVAEWAPRFAWSEHAEPIEIVEYSWAQYRPLPGVRSSLPGPRTAVHNLLLAGDITTHPSVEGAVASGHRAASIIDALVP
ncbi:MAG: FAD-dependent oxidoreductase [Miltoncostaeaceae bacterium]